MTADAVGLGFLKMLHLSVVERKFGCLEHSRRIAVAR